MVLRIKEAGKTGRLHLLTYRNSYPREALGSHGIPRRKCRLVLLLAEGRRGPGSQEDRAVCPLARASQARNECCYWQLSLELDGTVLKILERDRPEPIICK